MQKVSSKASSQSGFSLVELLVVILIISIVAALTFLLRGSANEKLRRQNVSQQLKASLERSRFDSVKRRAVNDNEKAYVLVAANSFTLVTDVTLNGLTTDSGDATLAPVPAGVMIRRYDGAAFDASNEKVLFNMRGEVLQSPPPQFVVCNGICPANDALTADIADVIIVTPTGTVNLLPGLPNIIPSFSNPAIAGSTSTTADINPDVTMP